MVCDELAAEIAIRRGTSVSKVRRELEEIEDVFDVDAVYLDGVMMDEYAWE